MKSRLFSNFLRSTAFLLQDLSEIRPAERGIIPLPKASSVDRMKENLDLFSFELEEEDMWKLATMPQAGWSGEHPDRARVRSDRAEVRCVLIRPCTEQEGV